MNKPLNVSTFIGCEETYGFAMQAIRTDSYGLETYSPYLDRDLEEVSVFDGGDLELPFGNTKKVLNQILEYSREVVKDGKKFLMVGGEHLVSLPTIQAVYEKYPNLHVIHIDAHTDLRDEYLGEELSHASVIRRCHDFLGDGRIFQFGIRSGMKSEFEWAKKHTYLERFSLDTLKEQIEKLKNVPVYVTIDLDVLDPGVFPGTGTPEPGGITYRELLDAIMHLQQLQHMVAADIVELSPHYDPSGASTAIACKTVREMLLTLAK